MYSLYPEDAKKEKLGGKIFIKFIVKKDEQINNIEILKGISPSLDEEAKKIIGSMNYKFYPATQRGILMDAYFTIPINFSLE